MLRLRDDFISCRENDSGELQGYAICEGGLLINLQDNMVRMSAEDLEVRSDITP